jgi:hypothetical protein
MTQRASTLGLALTNPTYLVLSAMLLFAQPVFGWESDVHYGLTKWLALQAGFSEPDAEIIAKGTWDRDHGINDAVHLVIHYACLRRDAQASKLVRDSHFPSFANLPAEVKAREVEAGGKAASREVRQEILDTGGNHRFDLEKFGAALHPLQDSWSHAGVPDPPLRLVCDRELSWGHPVTRGGYGSHDADLTYKWPHDTRLTAKITYEFMQAFLNKIDASQAGKPWDTIEKEVRDFGAADTKFAKEKWFKGHGFTTTEFLDDINLEDGEKAYAPTARLMRPSTKGLPDSMKAVSQVVPSEVQAFYASLFEAWTTEKDLMRFQGRLLKLGAINPGGKSDGPTLEGGKPDTLAAQLWTWRLRDHGLANKLGHGRGDFEMLMSATMRQEAMAEYKNVEEGLVPLGEGAPPYVIVPLSINAKEVKQPDQLQSRPIYGALARFKNAPHDLVIVIASENNGKLRIEGVYWTIDH